MKFKINRYPIYGLSIKSGQIQKFTKQEDAISFLKGSSEPINSIPIRKKESKPTPFFAEYTTDNSSDSPSNTVATEPQ